jgi:hypothetical protein
MDTIQNGPQNNPYLQNIINSTNQDVTNGVNSQFSLGGRYGSGAHTGVLSKELADADNQLRYQDYNTQQGRIDQSAAALTGANQGEASQALGGLGVAAELPYTGTNALSQQLAALFNGGNSKSVQYSPNPIWGAVGAGLGAAGAYFSDRRLKKNIVQTGTRSDGLNTYQWVYKNDPTNTVCDGFMADEVKEIYPEAYIEDFNRTGYAGVNYAAIPREAGRLMAFRRAGAISASPADGAPIAATVLSAGLATATTCAGRRLTSRPR